MKKSLISLLLLLTLLLSFAPAGCGKGEEVIGEDNTSALSVDLDYSKLSDTMLYDTMTTFVTKDFDGYGKTVKIRAEYGAYFNFEKNEYYNVIEKFDATACCAAYYEVRLADGVQTPAIGSRVEIVGKFVGADGGGYIDVTALTLYSGGLDASVPDIDTADLSLTELQAFLGQAGVVGNQHTGKTVRLCGHYAYNEKEDLHFLVGYKKNPVSGQLSTTWSIELHSETVQFPKITDNYVYAYEIIGTVSSYTVENATYPCIEVSSVRLVTNFTV